jgi:hypothetical protein
VADRPSCRPLPSCAVTAKYGPSLFTEIIVSKPARGRDPATARADGGAANGGLGTLAGWGTFSSVGQPAGTLRLVEHLALTGHGGTAVAGGRGLQPFAGMSGLNRDPASRR